MLRSIALGCALLAAVIVLVPASASAYVDPSAGSMLLQLLLGGVAGVAVIFKLYYRRVMTWLGRGGEEPERAAGDPPDRQ